MRSAGVVIPGQDGSCRQKAGREGRGGRKRGIAAWKKREGLPPDVSRRRKVSLVFFFWNQADQERRQSLVSKISQYSTSECSRRASFGGNLPSSCQINFSKLIYLRRVIRWLSRLLALTRPCLRDIRALCARSEIAVFIMPGLLRFRTQL